MKIIEDEQHFRRSIDNQPTRTAARVLQPRLKQVSRPHRLHDACLQRPQARKQCHRSSRHPQAVHVSETGPPERPFAVLIRNSRLDEDACARSLQPCTHKLRPLGVGLHQNKFIRNLLIAQVSALATSDADEQAETFAVETKSALHQSRTFLGG